MTKKNIELYVGIFVFIGLLCTGYLVLIVGKLSILPGDTYAVHGYFSSVSGLKNGARVEMAGVEIGSVADIRIDTERLVARVVLNISNAIEISEDSIASIKTSGIIGEKYIAILPGGTDILLGDGDELYNTESSLDIESLIRKFIFSQEST